MTEPSQFKPSFSPTEMQTRYAGMKFEHWVLPINNFELTYDQLADSDGYWFDDYASHLLDTHDYDDEELCNEMWSLVRYYGGGGEEFGKWYENRSQDSVDCPLLVMKNGRKKKQLQQQLQQRKKNLNVGLATKNQQHILYLEMP